MFIAHAMKRTLIIPPLLPHIGSKTHTKFGGRPGKYFKDANSHAVQDAKTVMDINFTEFPSWSEVIDYNRITEQTGVHVMDVWEFMRTEFGGALLNYTKEMNDMPLIKNWTMFIDEISVLFENETVALIGSAFALKDVDDSIKLFDVDTFERIRRTTLCFTPSDKVVDLIRASIIHIPKHYVGVHIRFGDMYRLSECDEKQADAEFNKLISNIRDANITKGSAIYLGSKDSNAKRCFDGHSRFDFRVFTLNDITSPLGVDEKFPVYNINAVVPKFTEAMDAIELDVGTKYLLIDMILVSLGYSYFFSRISFRPKSSTFQEIIQHRHEFRKEYWSLILNNSSDFQHLNTYE